VHGLRLTCPPKDVARQLEHVVAAAAFLRGWSQLRSKFSRFGAPPLVIAGAACAVGALRSDLMPEIIGNLTIAPVASDLVATSRADDFGNVGVLVQSLDLVNLS